MSKQHKRNDSVDWLYSCSYWVWGYSMGCTLGDPRLGPTDMQPARGKLDLWPLEIAQLASSQAVPVADQDHRRIAMAVAARIPSRSHQTLDFPGCEVFASSNWGIYDGWRRASNCPESHDLRYLSVGTEELSVLVSIACSWITDYYTAVMWARSPKERRGESSSFGRH